MAPPANMDDAFRPSQGQPISVGCGPAAGSAGLAEYVYRQPAGNGQRGVADSRLNTRTCHEPVGWDMPSTSMGRSELASGAAEDQDLLRDARILIVDDCTLSRECLAAIFALEVRVPPSAAWDLRSLMSALEENAPSVILVNIETRDCAVLLRQALDVSPNARVIVLGISEDDESAIVACAEAGVAGYHFRTEPLDGLLVLIRKVAAGESVVSPRISGMLLRRLSALAAQRQPVANETVLTPREAQILRMLELGLSNRDIAAQLCIAVHTVKNHVHSVLTKLGVNSRAEAAAFSRTVSTPSGTQELDQRSNRKLAPTVHVLPRCGVR